MGLKSKLLRIVGQVLKYGTGVLFWLILLGVISARTRLNVWSMVDGLWMRPLHDGLVRNVIGELAYRAESGYGDYGSGVRYIYFAQYRADSEGKNGELRPLSYLIDTATWHEVGQEGVVTTFRDARYEYRVRTISDGTDIFVVAKR